MRDRQVRIGVLGCSEFSARAMIPAMQASPQVCLAGVASRDLARAQMFAERFGCEAIEGYARLIESDATDAVYVPLPPGLHGEWVERCLDAGKHVLVEKPFVPTEAAARRLIEKARAKGLAIVENMLFPHHSQTAWVREQLAAGLVGEVRLFRCTFSIPPLKDENFRYAAELGGGVLLDMGPYMVRFATLFLGDGVVLQAAALRMDPARGIDISGSAQFVNPRGQVAQVSFSFDTHYQCSWEFLGTVGRLVVERGLTPPPSLSPVVHIERREGRESITLPADNYYKKMCVHFAHTTRDAGLREEEFGKLETAMKYLEQIGHSAERR